jgi:hypothetical protein
VAILRHAKERIQETKVDIDFLIVLKAQDTAEKDGAADGPGNVSTPRILSKVGTENIQKAMESRDEVGTFQQFILTVVFTFLTEVPQAFPALLGTERA